VVAAQEVAGTLSRYNASETPRDDFQLSRPVDLGHLRFGAQLHLDYASNPLVWESTLGEATTESAIVSHQLNATLGASFGVWSRLVAYAGLPLVLWMDGMDASEARALGVMGPDDSGFGDAYLGARVRLLGDDRDVGAIAAQGTVTLPTAGITGAQSFRGSEMLTFMPELLGELRLGLGSRLVANLGALLREQDDGPRNFALRHELTFGLGFAIPVWSDRSAKDTHLDLVAQSYGSTAMSRFLDREQTPLQASGGARLSLENGLQLGAAVGAGLLRGYGTAETRGILTVGYLMPEAERVGEPSQALYEPCGTGGCVEPPLDADGDGLNDALDRCPAEPEDQDGFEDEDGCAEEDNDGDGVLDAADRCPQEAGSVDNGGCADTDGDGDGLIDRLDRCPQEAAPTPDGCAAPLRVSVTKERIEIREQVRFATNSAEILGDSHGLLDDVASVLNEHTEIAQVRVEGHSDARGNADRNLDLSKRRAQAVMGFLVGKGVAASRLQAEGYGEMRPLNADAKTASDHEQNRRVEFHIVQSGTEGGQP
jgi:outer membrane protein OmpA-like peptidoglycan-associated protein